MKFIIGPGLNRINNLVIKKLLEMGHQQTNNPDEADFFWEYFHFIRVDNAKKLGKKLVNTRTLEIDFFDESNHIYNAIFPHYANSNTNPEDLRNPLGLKHKLFYILYNYYKNNNLDLKDLFSFVPNSFNLDDKEDVDRYYKFIEQNNSAKFLIKPSDLCEGKDILFISKSEISNLLENNKNNITNQDQIKNYTSSLFIQKFLDISNPPLLIKTVRTRIFRKFSLRVFILVASVNPLICFKYKINPIRCSLKKYNVNNIKSCVSNARLPRHQVDLNGRHSIFIFDKETFEKGNYMFNVDIDPNTFFNKIDKQVDKIIITLMKASKKYFLNLFGTFHLMALDLQIDKNLNIHLLEVNEQPSINYSDINLPNGLICGYLDIILKMYLDTNGQKIKKDSLMIDSDLMRKVNNANYQLVYKD